MIRYTELHETDPYGRTLAMYTTDLSRDYDLLATYAILWRQDAANDRLLSVITTQHDLDRADG